MKLTEQQIEQLFTFTKKHLVEHYDVQVELVDHLANAIEAQWAENPNISFEDALEKEFKSFGVFGFTGLVEQKQNELYKHYNQLMWKEVLSFFTIPKIILTICLYFALFVVLKNFMPYSEIIFMSLTLLIFLYVIVDGFAFIRNIKKQQKKTNKNWLIQSVATQVYSLPMIGSFSPFYSVFRQLFENESKSLSVGYFYLVSAFLLLMFIATYVLIYRLEPVLKNEIAKTEQKFKLA